MHRFFLRQQNEWSRWNNAHFFLPFIRHLIISLLRNFVAFSFLMAIVVCLGHTCCSLFLTANRLQRPSFIAHQSNVPPITPSSLILPSHFGPQSTGRVLIMTHASMPKILFGLRSSPLDQSLDHQAHARFELAQISPSNMV